MNEGALGVLIVDDEAPARSILREHLAKVPGVRVLGECANGLEALRAAGELSPDVVFLDIEMPRLSGFEVLELLDPRIAAVFVTAYDEWAVKAFEVHAVDYVLKPFEPARIAAAVERARERLASRAPRDAEALAAAARPAGLPRVLRHTETTTRRTTLPSMRKLASTGKSTANMVRSRAVTCTKNSSSVACSSRISRSGQPLRITVPATSSRTSCPSRGRTANVVYDRSTDAPSPASVSTR